MISTTADSGDSATLADTLPAVVTLLGGVPTLTLLAMMALRYIASGTI
ncbi:MAG: hypothetical protein ABR538_18420 [Candidatus Binatia bacterium]